MKINFYKYQGTGNDFIIIDNRKIKNILSNKIVKVLCDRKFGIGADGLMLIENDNECDFKMIYFNSDGSESTLCGNGSRCITKCVYDLGLIKNEYIFRAIDGLHKCFIKDNEVELNMNDITNYEILNQDFIINTGSPHYIHFNNSIDNFDLINYAHKIRYGNDFINNGGINVNVVEEISKNKIKVRTYERGVENETLSCGTGVTAAALAYYIKNNLNTNKEEIIINTLGGNLKVKFNFNINFNNIYLIGPAKYIFNGFIEI